MMSGGNQTGAQADDGPWRNRKVVLILAAVHLAALPPVMAVIAFGQSDAPRALLFPLLLVIAAVSFLFWVYAWHHNYRFVIAGFRLAKSMAAPYQRAHIDAPNWISARRAYAIDRSQKGEALLRTHSLSGKFYGLRLGPTDEGLGLTWSRGQRRLIPWHELTPLEPVTADDIVREDSVLYAFARLVDLRPMVKFSARRSPHEVFLIPEGAGFQVAQASGNRWPRHRQPSGPSPQAGPAPQTPPAQPQPPPAPPPPPGG